MKSQAIRVFGLLVIAILVLPSVGAAQTRPINIALFNPVQIFPESNSIAGLRINLIYGKNAGVVGLDWGLVNSVGSGGVTGIQWGFINLNDGNFVGLQGSLVNLTSKNVEGVQWGWYNQADHVSGLQIGLVNNTGSMKGLQIGLINIIRTGGFMPVFPIINFSF